MDWSKIAQDRCPRCTEKFHEGGMLDEYKYCSGSHCLFKINIDKYNKIKSDEVRRDYRNYNPEPNLEALNNLEL